MKRQETKEREGKRGRNLQDVTFPRDIKREKRHDLLFGRKGFGSEESAISCSKIMDIWNLVVRGQTLRHQKMLFQEK